MKFSVFFSLIILISCLSNNIYGQINEWEWANIVDCDFPYNMSPQITIDESSNIYVADNYGYSADFGTAIITSQKRQIFFTKYDSFGNQLWLNEFYTTSDICDVSSIDVSGSSVYLTGYFSDTLVIGGSTLFSSNERDVFIAKYDTSGTFEWAFMEGGDGYDGGQSIISNTNSDVIISGDFSENISIGDTALTAYDYVDIFVSKYNELGENEWNIHGYGAGLISVTSSTFDNLGFIYITGRFEDSLSINGYTITNSAYVSTFVLKIDQSGQIQWLKEFAGITRSIAIDTENNIYLGVRLSDKYLRKLDGDGNLLWEIGNGIINCNSLSFDYDDNIIAIGDLSGTVVIEGNEYSTDSMYIGWDNSWLHDVDIFTIKASATGDVLQVNHVKDYHTEGIGGLQQGWSACSNNNTVFVAGPYHDSAIFQGIDTLSGNGFFVGSLIMDSTAVGLDALTKNDFNIYPNPAQDEINISTSLPIEAVRIMDINGRIVQKSNSKIVRLEGLENGVYFISVVTSGGNTSHAKKFIKQ